MLYAFIELLAGAAGRGIPLVIWALETGGLGQPACQVLAPAVYPISLCTAHMAAAGLLQSWSAPLSLSSASTES